MKLTKRTAPEHSEAAARTAKVIGIILERLQSGDQLSAEKILEEFPDCAEQLRPMLPTMLALNELGAAALETGDESIDRPARAAAYGMLGDYRILGEVGRGGMGVVYEAEQISLARRVALKILPFAAVLDPRHLQRFKNEAMAAVHLDHSNIVEVYGIGCERSIHFYAMRFIEGVTLAEVVEAKRSSQAGNVEARSPNVDSNPNDEARTEDLSHSSDSSVGTSHASFATETLPVLQAALSTVNSITPKERFRRIAEIGIQAAGALDHAHQMGIVHRDIKPSNLMLDERGQLWVTDFGLARNQGDASMTMTGDLVGTLRYMSPEQASGSPMLVGHRSDIYSLGATLYELATAVPVVRQLERASILYEISEVEVASPRTHAPAMPADLETILLKCLAKEPSARYDTAQALADDLWRFLDHKPVAARREKAWGRALRWYRRRPGVVIGVLSACAIAATVMTVCSLLVFRAYRAESLAHTQVAAASAEAHDHLRQLHREVFNHQIARTAAVAERNPQDALDLLWDQQRCPPALRDFTWGLLNRRCRLQGEVLARQSEGLLCLALSPDETILAAGGKRNEVILCEAATGRQLASLTDHTDWVTGVAFLGQGTQVASSSRDGTVRVWDVAQNTLIHTLQPNNGRIESLAVAPDEKTLATGRLGRHDFDLGHERLDANRGSRVSPRRGSVAGFLSRRPAFGVRLHV